ncbi:hypothetical protein JW960_00190 [candidate division KSB1 bacterium]|nr:hypothetical protein [candidate division KSB1 bacterium]
MKLIFLFFLFLFMLECSYQKKYAPGTILFEDSLNGSVQHEAWKVAPNRFVELPGNETVFQLQATPTDTFVLHPWVGDNSWENIRLEVEFLVTDSTRSGFIGLQFHIQDDSVRCCNLAFYIGGNINDERRVETTGHWSKGNLSWKLWPFAQRSFQLESDKWFKLRMDIGKTIANVYVNKDSTPVYTTYDLPFANGGIRFWQYGGSAYFRNLKVTALGQSDVQPVLPDPFKAIRDKATHSWEITELLTHESGIEQMPSADYKWHPAATDARGVLNVTAAYPENLEKRVLFARATIESQPDTTQICHFSYTDRANLWLNGKRIYTGQPRGWFDPGRTLEDEYGRLIPDLFSVEVPFKTGTNEIIVGLEIKEPQFGSGIWMRVD